MSIKFDCEDLIVSGGGDNTIKARDVKTGNCLNTLEGHKHFIWAIDILQKLQILVSGSQDNTIKFWDIKTGECLKNLAVPRPYEGTNIVGVTGLTESQKKNFLVQWKQRKFEYCPIQKFLCRLFPKGRQK